MSKFKKKLDKIIQHIIDKKTGSGVMQDEVIAEGERFIFPGMPEAIRQAGAEGTVLLKNNGVLPLDPTQPVAMFGRCQIDWFFVGYGSGGDVNPPYTVNLMEAMKKAGVSFDQELAQIYTDWTSKEENKPNEGWWGHWPMNYDEMPISKDVVEKAASRCKTALFVIGRSAGEDRENTLTKGSFYLTDEERVLLSAITDAFENTVVIMNIGGVMDFSWTEEYGDKISALLIPWQGGMESGNAVADVLYGKVNPSGKLPDTIARHYEDYPSSDNFGDAKTTKYEEGIFVGYRYFDTKAKDKVLYPFGFGLSYTTFKTEITVPASFDPEKEGSDAGSVCVKITNTGDVPGKEVVQLYVSQPAGRLEKAAKVLVNFAKTEELAPGASQEITVSFDARSLSSYDEALHAFVLEQGDYSFTVNDEDAGKVTLDGEILVQQCEPALTKDVDLKQRILDRLPEEITTSVTEKILLSDVASGKYTLDDFVAQLTNEELEALTRGHGMMYSELGVPGNAGTFGGIIPSLQEKGVPALSTSDGPAGLRLKTYTALIPCGTALSSSWNRELTQQLGRLTGQEMAHNNDDIQLAPGLNIHRSPLCGRNFEYFSEDPVLSGRMAAAIVLGVQESGKASCPKHFACNNQETKRTLNNSVVSERALREIYLRNFEICVKEAHPKTIMTSYNKINGVWSHYNYDLVTTVLRKDWGFDGTVMTDWWMQSSKSPEFPSLQDNAYRVRAQVDVLMPGGDRGQEKYISDGTLLATLGQPEGITKAELQRTAKNVLKLVLDLKY